MSQGDIHVVMNCCCELLQDPFHSIKSDRIDKETSLSVLCVVRRGTGYYVACVRRTNDSLLCVQGSWRRYALSRGIR